MFQRQDQYIDSINIIDGFARSVETAIQSPAGDGTEKWIVARSLYDDVGRLIRQSEGEAQTTQPTTGRTITDWNMIDRDHRTRYDDLGRVVNNDLLNAGTMIRTQETKHPGGYTTTTSPAVNVTNGTPEPPDFGSTTMTADVYGNTVAMVEEVPGGSDYTTRYGYNMRFDQVAMTDPIGATTTTAYNNLGWVTALNEPNAGASSTVYYRTGEIRQTVDAKNQTISYAIDEHGRPTDQAAGADPTLASARLATFTYDSAANGIGMAAQTQSYQPANVLVHEQTATDYDNRGRLTDWTTNIVGAGDPATTSDDTYTFSNDFRRSGDINTMTYPAIAGLGTEVVNTTYTTLGYRSGATSDNYNYDYINAEFYDDIGRRGTLNLGDPAQTLLASHFEYSDVDGRLDRHTVLSRKNGSGVGKYMVNRALSYDAPGNLTEDHNDVGLNGSNTVGERQCHSYDTRQRLERSYTTTLDFNGRCSNIQDPVTPAGPASYDLDYAYDAGDRFTTNADRTSNTYGATPQGTCKAGTATSKPHAYTAIGVGNGEPAQTFTYDCNGAMTSRTETGGDTWTYTYDQRQRLATTKQGTNTASQNIYDATGQRIMRIDPNGDRTAYYGTTELRYTATTQNVSAARYYPGGGIRTFDNGANNITWTATDEQGSITAQIDNNTQQGQSLYYDPYGTIRSGNTVADKAFLNQTRDEQQDLTYLNNRHYSPDTGVFLSVDPMVNKTGQPYIYGAANPVRFSDPSGLDPDTSSRVRSQVESNGGCTYSSGYKCFENQAGVKNQPHVKGRGNRRQVAQKRYAEASLGYGAVKQLVSSVGNLGDANRIVVFVPGAGSNLGNFNETRDRTRSLVGAFGDGTAGIAWMGYDAPQSLFAAASGDSSDAAHGTFGEYVTGLTADYPGAEITIVGHSYGSVVAGRSIAHGEVPNDSSITFATLGSPGYVRGDLKASFKEWSGSTVNFQGGSDLIALNWHGQLVGPSFATRGGHSNYWSDANLQIFSDVLGGR